MRMEREYRSQKKFDFERLFSDVAARAQDLNEETLEGLPCMIIGLAYQTAERRVLRYTAGHLSSGFGKEVRSRLMSVGRLDLEVQMQSFMSTLVKEGADAAWDVWAFSVSKDDHSNLRAFLKKSAFTPA